MINALTSNPTHVRFNDHFFHMSHSIEMELGPPLAQSGAWVLIPTSLLKTTLTSPDTSASFKTLFRTTSRIHSRIPLSIAIRQTLAYTKHKNLTHPHHHHVPSTDCPPGSPVQHHPNCTQEPSRDHQGCSQGRRQDNLWCRRQGH
jgi:hypothetical protein